MNKDSRKRAEARELAMATQILEINLISAQGLKSPSSKMRRMQTYALVWINSSTKLRTRVDQAGAENPIWNEKFLFKVTPEFLSSETSAISVEIYAGGYLRDYLIGTVRFLVSNISFFAATKTPSFTAFQIRRPSGRFHGVLSIGSMLIDGSDLLAFSDVSAIAYRELMRESQRKSKSKADESWENSSQCSEGADSTTSSSSTTSTSVLKDWKNKSSGVSILCGLLMERKNRSSPSDENVDL